MNELFNEYMQYMIGKPVISTHSHHLPDGEYFPKEEKSPFTLNKLLGHSYSSPEWTSIQIDNSRESRQNFLNQMKFNSYFVWLQKALREIYKMDENLTPENWDEFSSRIETAHQDKNFHIKLLEEDCNYKKIVLDTFWQPGFDNGKLDLFTPTYRIDMYMYGWNDRQTCNNGGNPLISHKDENPHYSNLDEYLEFTKAQILRMKAKGCVALKSAIAYHRGNNFLLTPKNKAKAVFEKKAEDITTADIKCFQDYVFHAICKIAVEVDLPFQVHTGMAQLRKSNGMNLLDAIENNPDTKFILFHGNYPWVDDYLGLLHNYQNIYPDICWMPILSTSRAVSALKEIIEIGTQDKICWGCDTWTSEESMGALMAARFVFARTMTDLVNDGYFSKENGFEFIDNILYNNAKYLYKL